MKIDNNLLEAFSGFYTKAHLQKGYLPFVQQVFSGPDAPRANAVLQSILEKKNKNKDDLILLVTVAFGDKTLFLHFFSYLPDSIKRLFEALLWEDGFFQAELLEERYGVKITEEKGYSKSREVKNEFLIFAVSEKYDWRNGQIYFLGLPPGIKKIVSEYFDKPEGYYLQAIQAIPETFAQFNGEQTIFQELPRILAYENQGQIKLTNSGIPAVSTFSKMRKTLSLKEFYEGAAKPYDVLRTSLIATLLVDSGVKLDAGDPLEILKKLVHHFQHGFFPLHLLNYLKGLAYIENYYKAFVGEVLLNMLASFPQEEGWVSIENIRKYATYRMLRLDPSNLRVLENYAYYPIKENGYTDKISVSSYNYQTLVKIPLIKASFFLFAAFGLVEAAYAPPPKDDNEEDAWTPYDGLRYVRMTPLGVYLTGRTQNYKALESTKTSFQLLDDSLYILSDKPDETVDLLLDNYTVKVGPSRYKTDFQVFMKGIRNGQELEAKVTLFRQTVAKDIPPNWEAFFETLRQKCDPLKSIGEHMAYQLSQNDKEMINLVAKDPVLKKLVIKAEGLTIIVMKKDQPKFKARLKEFGYLLE
jgi:hypothetical protein